jgi:hypothetical protein
MSSMSRLTSFLIRRSSAFAIPTEDGRVRFSREMQEFQRRYRVSSLRYLLDADLPSVLTAPIIYSMVVPLAVTDLCFTLFHHICFRAYDVPRGKYLVMDRHRTVSEFHRKTELYLLRLRQRRERLCAGDYCDGRAVLVSDQACTSCIRGA